jgi:hypothetical protein
MGGPLRRALATEIPPLLRRANQLMAAGQYAEAASALEQLARAAEARGGPRAPFLHIQAGRARAMAGQPEQALEGLERGLGLLAARGQTEKLRNFGGRVVAELNQRGHATQASQLSDYLGELSPDYEAGVSSPGSPRPPLLPTHCPGCGAPVRPDEVEWLDTVTAECAYCGSPVRGG